MYYRSGTGAGRTLPCSLIRWQQFCEWNDVMAAILKVWRQIENPTLSIDAFYVKKFPPNFIQIQF